MAGENLSYELWAILFPKKEGGELEQEIHIVSFALVLYLNWDFDTKPKVIAQKMGLPRPLEVLEAFGGKFKSKAPRAFKFCTKRVPI